MCSATIRFELGAEPTFTNIAVHSLRPSTAISKLTAIVLGNFEARTEFAKQGLDYTLLPDPDIRKWGKRSNQ